jgi:hypothetical protein
MKVATQDYVKLLDRFIELANQLKNEGTDINIIANALMEASSIYATYVSVGNEGYLKESGIDKMTDAYRQILTRVQAGRKARVEARQES